VGDVTASVVIVSAVRWARHLLACAILAMPVTLVVRANAAQPPAAESSDPALRVKAAYLYKFAGYVEWPSTVFDSQSSPIVIGVIGNDDLEEILARTIVGKTANGRPLVTRRLTADSPLQGVHMLFVGAMGTRTLQAIGDAARGKPVLVVSDAQQERMLGSMISFDLIDQHLRFDVALKPVASSGLELRALMLTAARRVARDDP
jgi:hypothetical protein